MKQKITAEDLTKIEDQASAAKYFLNNKRFEFIREYMLNALKDAEAKILNNTIREVREELTTSEKLKRVFITPKQLQVDELAGAYKYIQQFFADMQQIADTPRQIEEELSRGKKSRVYVETNKEKTTEV